MKVIKVEKCLKCPYQVVKNINDRLSPACDLMDIEILKVNSIPEWCPLEDYPTIELDVAKEFATEEDW